MFGKKENNNKTTLGRYKDPTGEFSNIGLEVGSWYVRHKEQLRLLGVGLLAAWCAITIGYSFFMWGKYLLIDYGKDEAIFREQVNSFVNYTSIRPVYGAIPLQIQTPQVFEAGPGRYDFVADIVNPNERWIATITYKYIHSRGETEPQKTVLLPLSKRPVVAFGHEADGFPRDPRLLIIETDWIKVNAHVVPDVTSFIGDRLLFDYENFDFIPALTSEGTQSHRITFDITNNSAYSYWQPLFYIELYVRDKRVGILPFTLEQFRSGDTRNVDVRSLVEQLNVSDIFLFPIINVFDMNEFMAPGT